MEKIITNYSFDALAKTITFIAFSAITLDQVIRITNNTTSTVIFDASVFGKSGTILGNVLTLQYNTTGMSNTDKLKVLYESTIITPEVTTVSITNFPTVQPITDNGGSLTVDGPLTDTELRASAIDVNITGGSVSIGAEVEISNDSGNPIPIDGSGVTQPISAVSLPLPTGAALAANQQTNALTDIELRASPIVVSGSFTATPSGTQDVNIISTIAVPITDNSSSLTVDDGGSSLTVDGTFWQVTQPISASSLPLPTGAATSALQTQPGVDIGDVTINNASGAGAVSIQDGGNSITVDGSIGIASIASGSNLIGKTTISDGNDLEVSISGSTNSSTGLLSMAKDITAGTDRPLQVLVLPDSNPLITTIVDGNGDQITSFGEGAEYTDGDAIVAGTAVGKVIMWENENSGIAVAVSESWPLPIYAPNALSIGGTVAVTQSGTWDEVGINDSGNSITVDDGAGSLTVDGTVTVNAGTNLNTSLLALETGGNLASIKADTDKIPSLGQALAAASVPVVLTAAQLTTLTPIAAITGYATSANQTTEIASLSNLDVALSTRLKAADTLAAVTSITNVVHIDDNSDNISIDDGGNSITIDYATTGSGTATGSLRVELPTNGTGVIATVGAVTAITNALPAGTNTIGKLAANSGVDIGDVDVTSIVMPTLTKGTQGSTGLSVQNLKDAGRVAKRYYATAAAAGSTTTETAITLTVSSQDAATSTAVSFTPTSGKTFRIQAIVFATRGHNTATAQVTTFNLRMNTGGSVTTSSTPILLAMRCATPATANSWDRVYVEIPDGIEIVGDGTKQWGVTAAATYTSNAPTWDVTIIGFEY